MYPRRRFWKLHHPTFDTNATPMKDCDTDILTLRHPSPILMPDPQFLAHHKKADTNTKAQAPRSVSGSFFRRPRHKPAPAQESLLPLNKTKRTLSAHLKEAEELNQALNHALSIGGVETQIAVDMRNDLIKYVNGLQKAATKAVDEERMDDFTRITKVVDDINRSLDRGKSSPPKAVVQRHAASVPANMNLRPEREIASEWMSHCESASSVGRKAQWSDVWAGDGASEVERPPAAAPFEFYEGRSVVSQVVDVPLPLQGFHDTNDNEAKLKAVKGENPELVHLNPSQAPPRNDEFGGNHRESELLETVELQSRELQELKDQTRCKDAQIRETTARSQRLEKDVRDYKELWMRENARASSLSATVDEKEKLILKLSANEEALKIKLDAAIKRIKQLEFLMSRDNVNRLGVSPEGYAELVPKRVKSQLFISGEDTSNEWRDTAPTSTETIHRDSMGGSRARDRRSSLSLSTDCEPDENYERYRCLLASDAGILHVERDILEVGCRVSVDGEKALLRLYYGNLTMGCLDDFSVDFLNDSQQSKPESINDAIAWSIAPVPSCILQGQQICQSFVAVVSRPFVSQACCRIRFLLPDATPCVIKITLPLTAAHFLIPTTLSTPDFLHRWRSPPFVLSEVCCVVVVRPGLLNPMTSLTEALQLNNALDLHIGLDPDPRTLILAGTFPSFEGGAAQLVLARCELGAKSLSGKARLAIRSDCSQLARAVRLTLQQIIAA